MHVSTRLPFVGESLESVIEAYSPVPFWVEMAKQVSVPQVGVKGTVTLAPTIAEPIEATPVEIAQTFSVGYV
jgi:hypothetical protein